jgi:hypothetical protein
VAKQKFANNAGSMLAVSIDDNDTAVQVGGGHGSLFPLPAGGDFFLVTLMDASGNREIVKCTSRSSDVLTVERAQEGTTAQAWTGGACRVEARLTEGTMDRFVQTDGDYEILGELTLTGGVSGGVLISDAGNVVLGLDGKELRFGTGLDDLALGHDGTDSYIDANTGRLRLRNALGAILDLETTASGHMTLTGTGPSFRTYESDADADEKMWGMGGDASGVFTIRTRADDGSVGESAITVSRTGTVVDVVRLAGETRIDALNSNSVVKSGRYTPVITGVTNVDSAAVVLDAIYTRIGDTVHVQGQATLTPDTVGSHMTFLISLPIASDFTDSGDAAGLAVALDTGASPDVVDAGRILASVADDEVSCTHSANSLSPVAVRFSFSYVIN